MSGGQHVAQSTGTVTRASTVGSTAVPRYSGAVMVLMCVQWALLFVQVFKEKVNNTDSHREHLLSPVSGEVSKGLLR